MSPFNKSLMMIYRNTRMVLDALVEGLGVDLVLFLAHENCGAVGAAVSALDSGEIPSGLTRVFVEKIAPSVVEAKARGEHVELAHARNGAEHIAARIPSVMAGLENKTVGVVGAGMAEPGGM